jgi:hypothetical protein
MRSIRRATLLSLLAVAANSQVIIPDHLKHQTMNAAGNKDDGEEEEMETVDVEMLDDSAGVNPLGKIPIALNGPMDTSHLYQRNENFWGEQFVSLVTNWWLNESPVYPVLFKIPSRGSLVEKFSDVPAFRRVYVQQMDALESRMATSGAGVDYPMLHPISTHLGTPKVWSSCANIGMAYEDLQGDILDAEPVWMKKYPDFKFDMVFTGSTWHANLLEKHGQRNAHAVPRGIDTQLYSPDAENAELRWGNQEPINLEGKFVIYTVSPAMILQCLSRTAMY